MPSVFGRSNELYGQSSNEAPALSEQEKNQRRSEIMMNIRAKVIFPGVLSLAMLLIGFGAYEDSKETKEHTHTGMGKITGKEEESGVVVTEGSALSSIGIPVGATAESHKLHIDIADFKTVKFANAAEYKLYQVGDQVRCRYMDAHDANGKPTVEVLTIDGLDSTAANAPIAAAK